MVDHANVLRICVKSGDPTLSGLVVSGEVGSKPRSRAKDILRFAGNTGCLQFSGFCSLLATQLSEHKMCR